MNNPFSAGNKNLISEAVRNPIQSTDDLIPTYTSQINSAFDKAFFETGSGINRTERFTVSKELNSLFESSNLDFNDTIDVKQLYKMRFQGFGDEAINKKFGEDGVNRLDKIISNSGARNPSTLKGEIKEKIKKEVSDAEVILNKGDDITAQLIGGFGGIMTDPVILSSMFVPLGQEAAIAKTGSMVSRILSRSLLEGTVGAGSEILSSPQQKRNHAYLDKEFTVWDAAKNVAMAGAGGFLLTALGKSGLETFKYVRELRRGSDDAAKIITNNIDNTPDNQAAVKYMEDVSYTANRALDGDEFKPLYDESITPDQYVKHMEDSQVAYEEAMAWGEYNKTGSYDEALPTVKQDLPPRINDDEFYKGLLTEADRGYDAELFKQAAKIDIEIPVGTRTGEEGEIIIDTRTSKLLAKELDNELTALEGISMCMRGSS